MAQSVFPAVSGGVTTYTQAFTSSSTWTAPTSSTYPGVVTVTVVGGGGGGGGGAGGSAWPVSDPGANTGVFYGGIGGGGGGGGQVILQRQVVVPAGTSVPITVGAGGTGGTVETNPQILNYILNPMAGGTTSTGWSAGGGCTVARGTAIIPAATQQNTMSSSLYVALSSTTGISFSYDTGNAAFTPPTNSGLNGYNVLFCYTANDTTSTFTITPTVTWYNNTTLIRTDTGAAQTFGPMSSAGVFVYRAIQFNGASYAIPSNANRVVITFGSGTSNALVTWAFSQWQLVPREQRNQFTATPGSYNYYFIDPSYMNTFLGATTKPIVWSGSANLSTTNVIGGFGKGLNNGRNVNVATSASPFVCGSGGMVGSSGGNSSFGSYVTAYGGGGGGGGANAFNASYSNDAQTGTIGTYGYAGKAITGNTIGQPGGNGGGTANGQGNPTSSAPISLYGGGGGGAGGWSSLIGRQLPSTANASQSYVITNGGLGIQSSGSNPVGITSTTDFSAAIPANSSYYTPYIGGQGLGGFGAGGNGGLTGASATYPGLVGTGTYTSVPASPLDVGQFSTIAWPSTTGGAGGTSTYPSSGGAGANGSNGTNGVNYGDGGGGGGGGGSSTATTLNGTTAADPGNGGNGGNGANGIVIVSWSA